ncbi:MAG: FAD-dependent oxidoreductase [Bdellovibrionota bacterium]
MTASDLYYSKHTKLFDGSKLNQDIMTDVLVIGGGITGLSAACRLAAQGVNVILVEASEIGLKTVGRSAGMLTPMAEIDFASYGQEQINQVVSLSALGLSRLLKFIKSENLECQLQSNQGSLSLACSRIQRRHLVEEREIRNKVGMSGNTIFEADELHKWYNNPHFSGAFFDSNSHSVNPLALTSEMARLLERRGGKVYTNTEIISLNAEDRMAYTKDGKRIFFDQAILAQGISAYNFSLLKSLKNVLISVASHIMVTEKISQEKLDDYFPKRIYPHLWDLKRFFNYSRVTPDNRILFGGGEVILGGSQAAKNPDLRSKVRKTMERQFSTYFPEIKSNFPYFWGGIVPIPLDYMPFVGEVAKGITVAAYMQGINFGFSCGELVADSVSGASKIDKDLNEVIRWDRKLSLPDQLIQKCINSPFANPIVNKYVEYSDRLKIRA